MRLVARADAQLMRLPLDAEERTTRRIILVDFGGKGILPLVPDWLVRRKSHRVDRNGGRNRLVCQVPRVVSSAPGEKITSARRVAGSTAEFRNKAIAANSDLGQWKRAGSRIPTFADTSTERTSMPSGSGRSKPWPAGMGSANRSSASRSSLGSLVERHNRRNRVWSN